MAIVQISKKETTSKEDLEKLIKLFQQFNTNNIWSLVKDENDFEASRFELGYVNDIVCCKLTDDARQRFLKESNSKSKFLFDHPALVIKFMNQQMWLKIDYLELAIIATLVSQRGISPELVFAREDCHVNKFIKGRNYNYEDDCCPETVRQLANLLGRLHSLNPVPISNNGYKQWIELMENRENEFTKPFVEDKAHLALLEKYPELKKKYYDLMVQYDMIEVYDSIQVLIDKVESPLVFCHNDFNRGNRIVSCDEETGKKRIYLVDFDYSNYNNRGVDLGRYFSNYRHKEDLFGDEGFPSDSEMDLFLNEYRQEFAKHTDFPEQWLNDSKNSLEQLRDEIKVFTMQSYINDCGFALTMFIQQPEQLYEKFLTIFKARFEGYLRLKKMFTEDGTIDRIMAKSTNN